MRRSTCETQTEVLAIDVWVEHDDNTPLAAIEHAKHEVSKPFINRDFQDHDREDPWQDNIPDGDYWLSTRRLVKLVKLEDLEAERAFIKASDSNIYLA